MGFLRNDEKTFETTSSNIYLNELLGIARENVTEENVMNIPSVSSSVDLILDLISMLNVRLYKRVRCDKVEEIENDNRLTLLNLEPNNLMTAQQFKRAILKDCILHGSGHALIEKNRNKFVKLHYTEENNVTELLDTQIIHKDAKLLVGGEEFEIYEFLTIAKDSKNGLKGVGILQKNKDILALALLEQSFLRSNLQNGGNLKGFFTSESRVKDPEELRAKIKSEVNGSVKFSIFNNGIKYNPIQASNTDMQILQNRKFTNDELRKIFNIPSEIKTNDDYRIFLKACITPYLNLFENALNKYLLLQKEKNNNYYFQFDVKELSKASIKERFDAYKVALDSGIKTINEVRIEENLENLQGMDVLKSSLGSVFYDITNQKYFTPNTGQVQSMGGEASEEVKEESKGNTDQVENQTE
ncbi:phage portal protein [Clostridium perfringens]|uniref:phage portal protein n=1 Tax=Clostridium perfringens TaxID=1502 RepID=UPI001CB5D29B|nr:phage portal protein [Clostridium perfringens]HBI7047382.1 phage portal protein [Clostridium perfringens]HBI7052451.1 phage portal protein [Clostridium perfringens]HBI7343402.1 phage portal protein [Clostridium perfringens]